MAECDIEAAYPFSALHHVLSMQSGRMANMCEPLQALSGTTGPQSGSPKHGVSKMLKAKC